MSTLEITENNQTAEFNITEQSVDITEVLQTLQISASDSSLVLNEVNQNLEIVSPAQSSLELVDQTSSLEIIPDAVVLNQTFQSGSSLLSVVAGETLGGHRAVYVEDGEAFYASPGDDISGQVVGITTGAAGAGAQVNVQFAGQMDEAGWEFSPGPVYIGADGTLVQNRPAAGWIINIGVAVTPTRLLINKSMSIEVA